MLNAGCQLAWPSTEKLGRAPYWIVAIAMVSGALLILRFLTSHMLTLVDFAATVAFLSAPLFAYLNYRVLSDPELPPEAAPPKWLRALAWAGLAFLSGFSVLFLIVRFWHGW